MIKTNQIYIPIPKARNTHCKVEINGDDMTTRVIKSSFIYPCTSGIGTFTATISNAFGQYNGSFAEGQYVKFYADNADATTLQFWGRIDYIKNNISDSGQFLEIEGRHRNYLLTETLVCYSVVGATTSDILKAIIDQLPGTYGFTQTNIATDTTTMNVEWNYKPFWDCVVELCNKAGFDCYVDNDLDFHYFEANSILNADEAIVEGDNFISTKDWGTDNTYEKTRVTAIGQDNEGLPIVYTAIVDDEGTDIREVFVRDSSANTEASVQNIAEAKLSELTNRNPQATIKSYGLDSLKPGENLPIIVPRQQINGQYKVIEIHHNFGAEYGGWREELIIEEEAVGTATIIQKVMQKTNLAINSDNINKLNYSYNFSFDDDKGTHSTTEITEGVLKTTTGNAAGTWISPNKPHGSNVTTCEIRAIGDAIPGTLFYASADGGNTWKSLGSTRTLYTFSPPGENIKIKVIFASESTQIKSLVLLYS